MPFLFVDYDQGAGGEHLCYLLSQTPQCVPLRVEVFGTGRKKVHDLFEQEFLKPFPKPKKLTSDSTLYNVSPSHRNCAIAVDVLGSIRSIRISNPPEDSDEWRFLKHNRIKKVLLARQPSAEYFIGELRVLLQRATSTDFLSRVSIDMDNATLQMLSLGIEPTEENKTLYIEQQLRQQPEPLFDYDVVIRYEDLLTNAQRVSQQLQQNLGIELSPSKLESYTKEYEAFLKQT